MERLLKVAVVGCDGFVGSALCRFLLDKVGIDLYQINRANFDEFIGSEFDVLVEAACNSKKYLADQNPVKEAELSIIHRIKTLTAFKSRFHIHISSVDVYDDLSDPSRTLEKINIDVSGCSNYGAHKLASELLVKHYAENWLIFRLSGMVGEGLRKNPVYDILQDRQIFINPESRYQFCNTDHVASVVWGLFEKRISGQIFNIAGKGTISPAEIYQLYKLGDDNNVQYEGLDLPRIVEVNTSKIEEISEMQETYEVISDFLDTNKSSISDS